MQLSYKYFTEQNTISSLVGEVTATVCDEACNKMTTLVVCSNLE